jgi:hypothetical protein
LPGVSNYSLLRTFEVTANYIEIEGTKYSVMSHELASQLNVADPYTYEEQRNIPGGTTEYTEENAVVREGTDDNSPYNDHNSDGTGNGNNSGASAALGVGTSNDETDITCAEGTTYDNATGQCVVGTCPENYVFNSQRGKCYNPDELSCNADQTYDPVTRSCVQDNTSVDVGTQGSGTSGVESQLEDINDQLSSGADLDEVVEYDDAAETYYGRLQQAPIVAAMSNVATAFDHAPGSCSQLSFTFAIMGHSDTYSTSLHCEIFDSVKEPLGYVMLAMYAFLGVVIILRA